MFHYQAANEVYILNTSEDDSKMLKFDIANNKMIETDIECGNRDRFNEKTHPFNKYQIGDTFHVKG